MPSRKTFRRVIVIKHDTVAIFLFPRRKTQVAGVYITAFFAFEQIEQTPLYHRLNLPVCYRPAQSVFLILPQTRPARRAAVNRRVRHRVPTHKIRTAFVTFNPVHFSSPS
jgi:hypothetical protein